MQMDEYINKTEFEKLMRKKAIANFDLYYYEKSKPYRNNAKHYHDKAIGCNMAADEAHIFPNADVQPVRHGRWELTNNPSFRKCSECDTWWSSNFTDNCFVNYCPRCGARMNLKEGDMNG
jgi:Zn-finger nucleic acid-binding protein